MAYLGADLTDKVAVVTGGSGVLGREFCLALLKAGAKVAILGIDEKMGEEAVAYLNEQGYDQVKSIECDVLNKEKIEAARLEVNNAFGTCDILVNAAGGNHPKGTTSKEFYESGDENSSDDITSFFDLDVKGIDFVFALNYMGTLLPSQVFGQDMVDKEVASIINISSMNAFTPLTKIPAYSGAKAAVNNFTQWLAVHFANTNIRVNAIAPGFFETAQNKALLRNEDGTYSERANKILVNTPKGRFGKPEELLGTLMFLTNNEASGFITGVVIPIDGGFNAYSGV